MDCSALMYTFLGIFLLVIGSNANEATADKEVLVECYECIYYKGEMELNPQCANVEDDSQQNVVKRTDCKFCKNTIFKFENETRIYIKRQCARFCNHMKEVDVSYKDIHTGTEYCCQTDLCNVGDNANSIYRGTTLTLLLSAILSFLLCLR